MDDFDGIYDELREALLVGHERQIALVAVAERAYEYLEANPDLGDDQVVGLRMLLSEAENRMGRYFGM